MSVVPKTGDNEKRALEVLASYHDHCIFFRTVAKDSGLTLKQARRAVRSLARKGLAMYVRGLFDEEGMLMGSGYCCTKKGYAAIKQGQGIR